MEDKRIHKNISKLTQEKTLTHWMETKGKEEEEIKDDMDAWKLDAWKNSTAS